MPKIIKDQAIEDSALSVASVDEASLAASNVLLPLKFWLSHRNELKGRNDVGIWLNADEEAEDLGDLANEVPVIALHFPAFSDGRSLSNATLLRRRFGFTGELRAIGDVRRDQLEQMHRCGFNAFELASGQDPQKALAGLEGFTYNYQDSIDRPIPLFRKR